MNRSWIAFLLVLAVVGCSAEGPTDPNPAWPGDSESSAGDNDTPDGDSSSPSGDTPSPTNDQTNEPRYAAQWCVGWRSGTHTSGYPAGGPVPDPHADFYADVTQLSGESLWNALAAKIDNHEIIGYDTTRKILLQELECRDNWVECVYTGMRVHTECQFPDNELLNTEHTWPASEMTGTDTNEGSKSDLHNLFAAQQRVNSLRGSLPFGNPLWQLEELFADPTDPVAPSGSRIGLDDFSNRLFESRVEHKGNAARAMFYYALRYDRAILADQEKVLRCRNALDPPDDVERSRNDRIASQELQGEHNRNPFIDHPEYVDRITDF